VNWACASNRSEPAGGHLDLRRPEQVQPLAVVGILLVTVEGAHPESV
jgi:hypothetical protein